MTRRNVPGGGKRRRRNRPTRAISVRAEVHAALDARAKELGVPVATLVDDIVAAALEQEARTS